MPRHGYTVLCERTFEDTGTGNYSVVLLEQLNIDAPKSTTFPADIPFETRLISTWLREGDEAQVTLRVRVLGASGNVLRVSPPAAPLFEANQMLRAIFVAKTTPIDGEGVYWFVVDVQEGDDWREAARVPLRVTITNKS